MSDSKKDKTLVSLGKQLNCETSLKLELKQVDRNIAQFLPNSATGVSNVFSSIFKAVDFSQDTTSCSA